MSTYQRETKHPVTGQWEKATWYDDVFGNHNYGVVFPSDAKHFKDREGYDARPIDLAFNPATITMQTRD